jgi:NADPH:quinone reductase
MKALLSTATGGPETLVLGDLPEPVAGPGQVVVAVKACSINFPDTLIIEDRYQFKPPRPFAPGGEIAGLVDSIGEGVTGFAVGDRVLAGCGNGGLSEKIVLGTHNLYKMPDEMSFEEGASLLMTYGTSAHALKDRGRMKPGESVLVLGGAGGIGISAIELAKAYGGRVVAGVSSEAKAQAPMVLISSMTRSAVIIPNLLSARSHGKAASSSSASRPVSPSFRST